MLVEMGNSSRHPDIQISEVVPTVSNTSEISNPVPENQKPVRKKHARFKKQKTPRYKKKREQESSKIENNNADTNNDSRVTTHASTTDQESTISHRTLYQNFVRTPRQHLNFSDFLIRTIRGRNASSKSEGIYISHNFFHKQQVKKTKLKPLVVRLPQMTDVSDSQSQTTEQSDTSKVSKRTMKSHMSTVKEDSSLRDVEASMPNDNDSDSLESDDVDCACCWS